ncbi:hypothetical protein AB0J35_50910 [Nonomuraea angiospora]|uniref:hypothetical protein n=1 Tax=Nonomuraea angiospora TaxID=46172 RepID=UPI003435C794
MAVDGVRLAASVREAAATGWSSAAAVDCYYIYKCIGGTKLRAHCCDGSCGKYVIVCNTCC